MLSDNPLTIKEGKVFWLLGDAIISMVFAGNGLTSMATPISCTFPLLFGIQS